MNQLPPAPDRLLNLDWVLVAFDHRVNQLVDLALDRLVGDRDLLWHCSPPDAVSISNKRAKRIPKLYWDLASPLILVVGGIEKFDMNLRRQRAVGIQIRVAIWRRTGVYFWLSCFSTREAPSFESGVTA